MLNWMPFGFQQYGPEHSPTSNVAATTFDSAHKTNCTLSNGNKTALHSGGGNSDLNAFSIAATTTNQKVYVECNVVQQTFGGFIGFSSVNTSTSRLDSFNASPSFGFSIANTGAYQDLDSVTHGTTLIPSFVLTDNIDVAFDTGNNKVWFRKNNGSWNASQGGSQDPAANQGGAVVTAGSGGWYFFIGADAVDGDGYTATFSSSSWVRTAPSGFTQLA